MVTQKRKTRFSQKKENIFLLLVGTALLMGLIMVFFFPMSTPLEEDDYIQALEERIHSMEQRLAALDLTPEHLDSLRSQANKVDHFIDHYNQLDASIRLKTNLLAERIDTLESTLTKIKTKTPVRTPVKSIQRKPQRPAPKKKKNTYHLVKKGDTFYGIAKRYGISLDTLKKLNGFTEKTTIYPGQKITVK